MTRLLPCCCFVLVACGSPMTPQHDGGGFVFPTGGGVATTGGGSATGGGVATTGGGSATGGGGQDAGAPLTWSNMAMRDVTSTSYVIGLSGEPGNLWALQDTGHLFRSTGGEFVRQFAFTGGAKAIYASGNTVVVLQTRRIRTCTSGCTQDSDFATLDLLNSGLNWNLFGGALCAQGPSHVIAAVSDTNDRTQLFEWNGTSWARTISNFGIDDPRACWFDVQGRLFISGEDAVAFEDNGAVTTIPLSANFSLYFGGANVNGTNWVTGQYGFVASGTGATLTALTTGGGALYAAGGLRADEVFLLGAYNPTNGVGSGYRWDGAQLRALGNSISPFGPQSAVRVIHPASATELYLAGTDGTGPVILRGRR